MLTRKFRVQICVGCHNEIQDFHRFYMGCTGLWNPGQASNHTKRPYIRNQLHSSMDIAMGCGLGGMRREIAALSLAPNLYSRSPKVGNPIASILKSNV